LVALRHCAAASDRKIRSVDREKKAGNVVGMVVSKLNVLRIARMTGDIPQNVNFAIPASIITSVLMQKVPSRIAG